MAEGARMLLLVSAKMRPAWELPGLPELLHRPQRWRGQEKFACRLKKPPASFSHCHPSLPSFSQVF